MIYFEEDHVTIQYSNRDKKKNRYMMLTFVITYIPNHHIAIIQIFVNV